jgi:hypothetical protein
MGSMPGLDPGIHVSREWSKNVDGRDKPGHDENTEKRVGAGAP